MKTVCDVALESAIFYNCETSLTRDLRTTKPTYMSMVELFIRVQPATCNYIAMIEAAKWNVKS